MDPAPNQPVVPGKSRLWGDAGTSAGRLLVPGRNCWRVERADRLAVLIDGASYFSAVRSAIAQATRSVFILGWDFDSRIRLVPKGANDGYPEALGEFLRDVVGRRRDLRMYILSWDFTVLFTPDREWMPLYKLGWRTQPRPRLSFRLDDTHPLSGVPPSKSGGRGRCGGICGRTRPHAWPLGYTASFSRRTAPTQRTGLAVPSPS